MLRMFMFISLFLFSFVPVSHAQIDDIQGILAIAKMTGACGIMDSMIHLQKTTQLEGGDEFVTRFWKFEAARQGKTVEELSETCNMSVAAYNKLWEITEEVQK